MRTELSIQMALRVYDLIWRMLQPFVSRNSRLNEGIEQRRLDTPLQPADLWIQAASVGEAYLALEIIKQLRPPRTVHILVTTNTRQGMDILESGLATADRQAERIHTRTAFCPFDRPALMQKAIQQVSPRVVVLLETEIWPGLLATLKHARIPVLIINGRITARSLKRYRIWPRLWRRLKPDQILAISQADAARFGDLFGTGPVAVMPNIKFDRLKLDAGTSDPANSLASLLVSKRPFAVLGSVRQPEEKQVTRIIRKILAARPDAVIGLFPRHSHRLSFWQATLATLDAPWTLRSTWDRPLEQGGVVLWDTFGELGRAYESARTAFVGGSLVALGGQNFLEPLICGVRPVIGPYWDNFKWVGDQIFEQHLVRIAADADAVAGTMIADLTDPANRINVQKAARTYIEEHQGGTEQACRVIRSYLVENKQ